MKQEIKNLIMIWLDDNKKHCCFSCMINSGLDNLVKDIEKIKWQRKKRTKIWNKPKEQ